MQLFLLSCCSCCFGCAHPPTLTCFPTHFYFIRKKRGWEKKRRKMCLCVCVCGVSILGVLLGRHPVSFNEYLVNIYVNSVFRSVLSASESWPGGGGVVKKRNFMGLASDKHGHGKKKKKLSKVSVLLTVNFF